MKSTRKSTRESTSQVSTPTTNGRTNAKGKSRVIVDDDQEDDNQPTQSSQLMDPTQSPSDRRVIRSSYRRLILETTEKKTELLQRESSGLEDALDQADELYKAVKMPREAALDSEFLGIASNLGLEKAKRVQTGIRMHEITEFVTKLKAHLTGRTLDQSVEDATQESGSTNHLDWIGLGRKFSHYFLTTPTVSFMYGPLGSEAKERKERKKPGPREAKGPLVVPEQVKDAPIDEAETTKAVEGVKLHLDDIGEDGINFLQFVTNPNSFGQTIENIFHCSFLIKDGHAEMRQSEDGPIITTSNPPTERNYKEGKAQRKQSVVRFDYNMWLKSKEGVVKSALPNRTPGTYIHPSLAKPHKNKNSSNNNNNNNVSDDEVEVEDTQKSTQSRKRRNNTKSSQKGKGKGKQKEPTHSEDDEIVEETQLSQKSTNSTNIMNDESEEEEQEEGGEEEEHLVDNRSKRRR